MINSSDRAVRNFSVDKTRYIYNVLTYIEKHLTEELGPEQIASRHFISISQLYRDFYAITGHSVKEYIRKRRISNACEKIKNSDLSLSVIADESGCQTQQAFNKQFKNIVGMTPLEYNQSDTYFYFYPYSISEVSTAIKVGVENIPEWQVTRFYDSCLIGIEDKAIAALGDIAGRVFGRNGKQFGNRFCYEVMTEQNSKSKTALFATCTVNYNESEINDAWNYLYNTWLSTSMFEVNFGDGATDDFYFEEYLFKNGKPYKLKLYLPVKKRKSEHYITINCLEKMTFLIAKESGYNAERKASEKLMNYLQESSPILLRNVRKFYVCEYENSCECGIECSGDFILPDNSGLEVLQFPKGKYAVLPDDQLGDIRMGAAKIDLWLINNAIPHENIPVFAVYETINGKYETESIKMNLYKRLGI